jgi:[acyl-carrier-protein] S-malonyltransferase
VVHVVHDICIFPLYLHFCVKRKAMKGLLFPGQGAQHPGMGLELYQNDQKARAIFDEANDIMGFNISKVMFEGSDEDLRRTDITQPALFIHGVAVHAAHKDELEVSGVAGHSLGEFTALVAAGTLSMEDALKLVIVRANAMQKACEMTEGTMAAIVGLDDAVVEEICDGITDTVVTANYNCPGQLVISGSVPGIEKAVAACQEKGAKRAIILEVGGAFHSPLMEPAKVELEAAISTLDFMKPVCPIYQNVSTKGETDPEVIQENLILQLTSPVRWTLSMQNMIADGFEEFTEMGGKGSVLRGLMRRIDRTKNTFALV